MFRLLVLLIFCPFFVYGIDVNLSITSNGVIRTFILHAPGPSVQNGLPVVFVLHGDGGTGAGIKSYSGFDAVSNSNNFIAIYPDALNTLGNGIWNKPVNSNLNDGPNDVLFVSDMIDYLCTTYHINPNKVYATGHSGGAFMCYHLAINLPGKIAAIAPVAGNMYGDNAYINAHLTNPLFVNIPICHIHGDNDATVTYIDPDHTPIAWQEYPLSSFAYPNCGANTYVSSNITQIVPGVNKIPFCADGVNTKEISLIQIVGGGHNWPSVAGFDAAQYIWNFFDKYEINSGQTCELLSGEPSLLHVTGKYLMDDCDEKIILKGVNLGSIYDAVDKGIGETAQIAMTGANAVRIVLSAQYCTFPPPNYTCVTNTTTASYIEPMIQACITNKIIPVVELHDYTSSSNPTADLVAAANWWTQPAMLQMLLDHQNYLIINLANEPSNSNYPPTNAEQTTYYNANNAAITILRNAGYTCPIMIDGMHSGKDHLFFLNKGVDLLAADPLHNLLFSVHTYWPAGGIYVQVSDVQMTANINAMAASNLPFVIGEMAHSEIQQTTQVPINYQLLMNLLATNEMGYLVWWWGLTGSTNNVLSMTTNGMYNSWKPEGGIIAITHSNSIQNTSVRPYKFVNGVCSIILPINLKEFSGLNNGKYNELHWSFDGEIPDEFEVEYSPDGNVFRKVGTLKTNQFSTKTFNYLDKINRNGLSYYRLKVIEKNGVSTYSNIISIDNSGKEYITVTPNPATQLVQIKGSFIELRIKNVQGKIIRKVVENIQEIDISNLVKGVYFFEFELDGGVEVRKIVIQ